MLNLNNKKILFFVDTDEFDQKQRTVYKFDIEFPKEKMTEADALDLKIYHWVFNKDAMLKWILNKDLIDCWLMSPLLDKPGTVYAVYLVDDLDMHNIFKNRTNPYFQLRAYNFYDNINVTEKTNVAVSELKNKEATCFTFTEQNSDEFTEFELINIMLDY